MDETCNTRMCITFVCANIFLFTECPDNTYGVSCKLCSPNCKNPPCNKFSATGICAGGCLPGYHGAACLDSKVLCT